MKSKNISRSLVTACAAVALLLGLGATRASADSVTYDISVPNAALSPYTGTLAQVTVTLTDSTHATVTFNSCGPNETCSYAGYVFLMGSESAAGVNVNATSWTVSPITSTNGESGFTSGAVTDGGSGNVSEFGVFNQTFNSFDGFTHSSTTISFTLTNTSATWNSAADVLAANNDGNVAEIHAFVCADNGEVDCNATAGAIVTGFAADSNVPEPASLSLFGIGLIALAGMVRRYRVQAE